MSRLNFVGRPWVAFDATNKDHRRWFYQFQKEHTWGKCPVRFLIADDGGYEGRSVRIAMHRIKELFGVE